MKPVRLEQKNDEWRLVEKETNRIVSRNKDEAKCMQFLVNNKDYYYDPFKKGVHYVF